MRCATISTPDGVSLTVDSPGFVPDLLSSGRLSPYNMSTTSATRMSGECRRVVRVHDHGDCEAQKTVPKVMRWKRACVSGGRGGTGSAGPPLHTPWRTLAHPRPACLAVESHPSAMPLGCHSDAPVADRARTFATTPHTTSKPSLARPHGSCRTVAYIICLDGVNFGRAPGWTSMWMSLPLSTMQSYRYSSHALSRTRHNPSLMHE